jgi:hypothetical protein
VPGEHEMKKSDTETRRNGTSVERSEFFAENKISFNK